MYDPVPVNSERLAFGAVQKLSYGPSRYVPGAVALAERFECPACNHIDVALPEGRTRACRCGLNYQLRAVQVYVWPGLRAVA